MFVGLEAGSDYGAPLRDHPGQDDGGLGPRAAGWVSASGKNPVR